MGKRDDKILVIDDEEIILKAVSRIASAEGFLVDSEANAFSALKRISQENYSLILCDIMLPQMDGFAFLDEMQKRNILTPVMMITGYSTVENAVKSLYKGAIDFVPKPFTFEELNSSIRRGIKYYQIQKEVETAKSINDKTSVLYVTGPPKYKRLGNLSWMNLESEGIAVIGATDLFLETIEKLRHIELLGLEEEIIQGDACVNLVTDDELIHRLISPLSGRIIERNEKLIADINLLEKDPYFEGWIYKVIPSNIEYDLKYLVPFASDRM
jgi:FixJ family two-component response regulator/glycine cleavage system H lipoate-binding protein